MSRNAPTWKILPNRRSRKLVAQLMAQLKRQGVPSRDLRNRIINIALRQTADDPDLKMQPQHYILDEHGQPKKATSEEWVEWVRTDPILSVNVTSVGNDYTGMPIIVATRFDPIITAGTDAVWETHVRGGQYHLQTRRCGGDRQQALAQHEEMVTLARQANERKNKS